MPDKKTRDWKLPLRLAAEEELKRREAERRRRDVEQLVDRRVAQKQGVPA